MNDLAENRICQDPKIMGGQPVIRGTRITVALILRELGRGATPAEIVDQYSHLTTDDVRAAASYAADVVGGETLVAAEQAVARFLVDECVPRDVLDGVRALGHDAVLVRDVIQGASDEDVLEFAQGQSRIMLTEDRRFGLLAINCGHPSCGVVILTLDKLSPAERAKRVSDVLPSLANEIAGSVLVIGPTRVRRRPL